MGPVGIVLGRSGLVPVLESFEVSVAMEDYASASFLFACPSCSVKSVIVFDIFATVLRYDCVAVARFSRA